MTQEELAKGCRVRAINNTEAALDMLKTSAMDDLKTEAEINKESACNLLALVCAQIGGGA